MQAIFPRWAAPAHVHALTTIRTNGVSQAPFDSFNLGGHVGDDPASVAANRRLLEERFKLPQQPLFLNQTHSTRVIELPYQGNNLDADATYSKQASQVCLVMTADCLPVLFCDKDGCQVAAAHAGWRGLCDGVLEETVAQFSGAVSNIMAWLGPAIGPDAFRVGEDVIAQFVAVDPNARLAFREDPNAPGKYLGDLYQIARQRLNKLGIHEISGGEHCTFHDAARFFSYRRDNQTGRMASLIWFE